MAANAATNQGTAAAPQGSCGDPTVRISVARTRRAFGGTAVPASTVKSETKGLRVAYPGSECNIPLIP
jgi:hypothetical protein